MRFVEMVKDGIVKLTVERFADELKAKGWERIGQQKPQVVEPVATVEAKPRRKTKEKR